MFLFFCMQINPSHRSIGSRVTLASDVLSSYLAFLAFRFIIPSHTGMSSPQRIHVAPCTKRERSPTPQTTLSVRVARATDRAPVTEVALPQSATVADLVAAVRDCADFTAVEPSAHRRTIARLLLATPPPLPFAEITQSDYEWGSTVLTSVGVGDGCTVYAHFCASAEEAATADGVNSLHAARVAAVAACEVTRRLAGVLLAELGTVARDEAAARAAIVSEEEVAAAEAMRGGLISAGADDCLAVRRADFPVDGQLACSRPLTITNTNSNVLKRAWVTLPNVRVLPGQYCAVVADFLLNCPSNAASLAFECAGQRTSFLGRIARTSPSDPYASLRISDPKRYAAHPIPQPTIASTFEFKLSAAGKSRVILFRRAPLSFGLSISWHFPMSASE